MFRRLIPLAALTAVAVGCGQKTASSGSDETPAPGADPIATYTMNVPQKRAGEKYEVADYSPIARTITFTVANAKETKTEHEGVRVEYTETILEMPAGEAQPTKLTRVYKVAEWTTGKGKTASASFVGKTMVIEKKGEGYTCKVEGKELPAAEAQLFADEFGRGRLLRPEDVLPKTPVRLNEVWSPGPTALKDLGETLQLPVNPDKSKMTGRLTRVYTRGGRQFGVIDIRTELSVEGNGSAGPTGTLTFETTLDVVIDGSAYEGTLKVNATGALHRTREKIVEVQMAMDAKQERTVKLVR